MRKFILGPSGNSMISKQPGKLTALFIQAISLVLLFSGYARALPGNVDPSFGFAGKSVVNLPQGNGEVLSLAVQSDGKIVSAGLARDYTGAPSRFLLTRHNLNGSLDNTFGSGGIVITTFAIGPSSANAVALQSDGKIVAAGSAGDRFALARYNTDGSLDPTFGSGGLVAAQFQPGDLNNYSLASSLAIQSDGKIVIAGDSFVRNPVLSSYVTDCNVGLARFNGDGTPDPSFGTGGIVISDFGSFDRADGLAIQPDGKILIAGDSSTTATGPFRAYLFRHNSDGSSDQTFGSNGLGEAIPGSFDVAALALQPDGKIILNGTVLSGSPANADFALARFNSDGTLDSGFGIAGLAVTDFEWTGSGGSRQNVASSLTLQADAKILVGGYSGSSFALLRYGTDGNPDSEFGVSGLAITQVSSLGKSTFNFEVAASSSFSAGLSISNFIAQTDFNSLQCFALPDGSIIGSSSFFIPPGAVQISCGIPISSFLVEQPFALAVQIDGKIISGGVLDDKPVLIRQHSVPTPKITVMNSGAGVGGIWSPDGAISCGTRCSAFYDSGSTVLLGWATALGTYFAGWSGCAPIAGGGCSLVPNGDATVTAQFNLDISLDAVATTLPGGAVGMNYVTEVGLPGMRQPFNSRVASGSVPSGLALNGPMVSGVPKKAGNFRFTVEFTDSTGAKVKKQLTLAVQKPLILNTKSLKTARAGRSYSLALKATGGDRAYTWSIIAGALPTGFTLDASSGRITGMAASKGAYPLTLRVADGFGQRVERALSLIIN
jgi:uncharacterized delta-60 repeat protein